MTYSSFSRIAFPITLAIALLLAWRNESPAPPAQTPAPGVERAAPPVPAPAPPHRPMTLPPPGAVLTATPGPGPESYTNPPETKPSVWLGDFDRALDREFSRLEEREKTARDPVDLALVTQLKDKLVALDELWRRADLTTSGAEKMIVQESAQQLMGEIIQLGRADRNQRLTQLARGFGVESAPEIARFLEELDHALVETHLDWARLFTRGVQTPQPTP